LFLIEVIWKYKYTFYITFIGLQSVGVLHPFIQSGWCFLFFQWLRCTLCIRYVKVRHRYHWGIKQWNKLVVVVNIIKWFYYPN
jgi:hypothetical protein